MSHLYIDAVLYTNIYIYIYSHVYTDTLIITFETSSLPLIPAGEAKQKTIS